MGDKWLIYHGAFRFMAASKILGEETVAGAGAGKAAVNGEGKGKGREG